MERALKDPDWGHGLPVHFRVGGCTALGANIIGTYDGSAMEPTSET
jgi:hypothetical protein